MLLSDETLLDLVSPPICSEPCNVFCSYSISVKSFVGLVQYLFSLPCVTNSKLAFLSNNICQDPLENFFGLQRQRRGTCDNPNVSDFLKNTATLRVVNFCRGPLTGNCRGSKQPLNDKSNTPLQRRKSHDRRSY